MVDLEDLNEQLNEIKDSLKCITVILLKMLQRDVIIWNKKAERDNYNKLFNRIISDFLKTQDYLKLLNEFEE